MKIHLITVGTPKLAYAKAGWDEYFQRLRRFHQIKVTHLDDKRASDDAILQAVGTTYCMPLDLAGKSFSSDQLAQKLEELPNRGVSEISFVIGGPDGFGRSVRERADALWKLSDLTLPHDLAMVVMLEALYRASTINGGVPYHR